MTARVTLYEDTKLLSLFPHMHVRGKGFEYKATYPTGETETLLTVPKYDFNWQLTYYLKEPKLLPKGTVLECVARYDNSPNNPFNPGSEERRVLGRPDLGGDAGGLRRSGDAVGQDDARRGGAAQASAGWRRAAAVIPNHSEWESSGGPGLSARNRVATICHAQSIPSRPGSVSRRELIDDFAARQASP